MIVQPGQFKLRLEQIIEAFDLKATDLKNAVTIVFSQSHRPELTYTATLTKDGKGDTMEPLRFIRRKTAIRVLDKEDRALFSRDVPGEPIANPDPAPSSHTAPDDYPPAKRRRTARPSSVDPDK